MARQRDGHTSSSSDSSSSQSDSQSDSQSEGQGEESVDNGKKLEGFYAKQPRVDSRTPTLELAKASTDFYFGTVLKEGEMSREGKRALAEKYFLEPETFKRLQAPELKDTRLFMLANGGNQGYKETRMLTVHDRYIVYLSSVWWTWQS